jgi:hypothetical protein
MDDYEICVVDSNMNLVESWGWADTRKEALSTVKLAFENRERQRKPRARICIAWKSCENLGDRYYRECFSDRNKRISNASSLDELKLKSLSYMR